MPRKWSPPRFRDSAVRLSQRVCIVCLSLLDTEFFSPSFSFLSQLSPSAYFNLFSTAFDEELFVVESITTRPFNAFRFNTFSSALLSASLGQFVRIFFNLLGIRHLSVPQILTSLLPEQKRQTIPSFGFSFPLPEKATSPRRSRPITCLCIRLASEISTITCRSSCNRFATRRNLVVFIRSPVAEALGAACFAVP